MDQLFLLRRFDVAGDPFSSNAFDIGENNDIFSIP